MNKQKIGIIVFGVWFLIIIGWWLSIVFNVSQNASILDTQENNNWVELDWESIHNDLSEESSTEHSENNKEQQETLDDVTEQQAEILPEEITQTRRSVSILFPPFYTQQQINALSTLIKNESWIDTDARRLEWRTQYITAVDSFLERWWSIDMLVVPSTHFSRAKDWWVTFALPQGLQRFYHSSFHERMYHRPVTVVPFALDPLVLYKNKAFTQQQQFHSNNELIRFIAQYTTPTFLPLWQWLDRQTKESLQKWKEPFLHAQAIMHWFVRHALDSSNLDWLWMLINAPHWSSERASEQLERIYTVSSNTPCFTAPTLCLVTSSHSALWFGLLSESYYFEEQITKIDQFSIADVPFRSSDAYPMLWRGIIINKNSTRYDDVERRISNLLTLSIETNRIPYPRYMFGPTYSMIQRQWINKTVELIQSFKFNGVLIDNVLTDPYNHSIFDQSFLDMLGWSMSLRQYLQQQQHLINELSR